MSTPAAMRVWGSHYALYRHIWRSNVFGSLLQPLLYLLGIGLGVGTLVDRGTSADDVLGGVDYLAFLAPSLLATTAMVVVAQESLWPVMDAFKWNFAFRAMAATPLRPVDIVAGVTLWHATRAAIAAGGVAVVLAMVPATRSWGLLAAVPFAVLTGLAVSAPITAWSASRTESEQSFPAILRFGIMPMFLFAGAFYPIDQLPGWLQVVAQATPLYHGVELCRGVVLHTLGGLDALVHVAVLAGYVVVGVAAGRAVFIRRLAE